MSGHLSNNRTFIILTDDFPPTTGGGIASWAFELSRQLELKNQNVIVLTRKKDRSQKNIIKNNIKIRYVAGHDWNRYRWLYMSVKVLGLLFTTKNPVIVGSTWQHLEGIVFLKKIFSFSVICYAHGTDVTKAISTNLRNRFRRVLSRIDVFVSVSKFLKKVVKKAYPNVELQSAVVHNSVNVDHFKPMSDVSDLRNHFAMPQDATILLSVGRTIEAKGFRQVIHALPDVLNEFPNTLYCIAGLQKEPEAGRIKSLISEYGLERNVKFLSIVDFEKLPGLYNACDIFIAPSIPVQEPFYQEEGLGIVILEASACGRPVIGTVSGGIPEVINDGITGFLVPPNNKNALAEKILQLSKDKSLRVKLGQEGRKMVAAKFRGVNGATKLLEIIENLDMKS